jgi:hypothetical protein
MTADAGVRANRRPVRVSRCRGVVSARMVETAPSAATTLRSWPTLVAAEGVRRRLREREPHGTPRHSESPSRVQHVRAWGLSGVDARSPRGRLTGLGCARRGTARQLMYGRCGAPTDSDRCEARPKSTSPRVWRGAMRSYGLVHQRRAGSPVGASSPPFAPPPDCM